MHFVRAAVKDFGLNSPDNKVLEIGSYNVNGSVRELFDQVGFYVGVDTREGPGVDVTRHPGCPLPFAPAARGWDVIVSTEMLEHDPRPWLTFEHLAFVTRPATMVVITTRGFGYGRHDQPADYWRFSEESMRILFDDAAIKPLYIGPDSDPASPGVFALGYAL